MLLDGSMVGCDAFKSLLVHAVLLTIDPNFESPGPLKQNHLVSSLSLQILYLFVKACQSHVISQALGRPMKAFSRGTERGIVRLSSEVQSSNAPSCKLAELEIVRLLSE